MFEFKYEGEDITKVSFSKLKLGETFCHSLPVRSVFMKKPHDSEGGPYQSIDLENGQSLRTDLSAECIPIMLKAFVEL